jgi:cellulose biosynthesis protein BcsQ
MKKSIYVAFSNRKGGVGKSAFTTLAASYLHYGGNRNVAVIDCDYPQHSIHAMRERDKSMVMNSDVYKAQMVYQHGATGKKACPVLSAKPEDAVKLADDIVKGSASFIDVVFFDLPGTVLSAGILNSMLNMDYLFCPIISDRLVMQSSLTFVSAMQEYLKKASRSPLQSICLFWNQLVKSGNRELYDAYHAVIKNLNLNLLQTEIPFTVKYRKEMSISNRQVFRSTLFPPHKALIKGTNLDLLVDEICQIINIQ